MCFSVSQGSVATRCVCGGKYDTNLVANLLMSLTMKKNRKSVNMKSIKWHFLWPTVYNDDDDMDQCHVTVMSAQKRGILHPLFCTAAGFD